MKRSIAVLSLLAVAACGGQPTNSGGGTGFSTGAGKPAPQTVAVAPSAVVAPSGQHDRLLATVKPRVLKRMASAEPVKTYSGTAAGVSRADLAGLSPRGQDAIVGVLPKPNFWTGNSQSHVSFRAGLVGGTVARARVNGQDFAHMTSGTFIPKNRDQMYALIAYRSGCKWNGTGTVVKRSYPGTPNKVPTWFVGLSC